MLVWSSMSFAAGTVSQGTVYRVGNAPTGSTAAAACQNWSQYTDFCASGYTACGVVSNTATSCVVTRSFNGTPAQSSYGIVGATGCPANSTGTTTCTCNAGYKPDTAGTSCVAGTVACPSAGTQPAAGQEFTWTGGSTTRFCQDGCQYAATVVGTLNGVRTASSQFVSSLGNTCDATPSQAGGLPPVTNTAAAASAPSPCGVGMCPGTVNGARVCVACSSTTETAVAQQTATSASGVTTPTSSTVTTNTRDGNGSITGSTTTYNPNGTSTTTTTTGETQTPGSEDSDDKEDKDFCVDHPDSALCITSTISGTCGAISCTGDAIQCAMAREQAKRGCELFDTQTALSTAGTNATTAGDRPGDHPHAPGNMTSSTFSIDQTDSLSGSCPADMTIGSVVLPLSKLCPYATIIGNAMVAFAALACVMIVFGLRRD